MECGHRMQAGAAAAFTRLQGEAAMAGFDLAIASSFRSFERQQLIWNGKASGQRPIHTDTGELLESGELSAGQLLHAILRFSALPGTSRHHWGSDVDIYDRAAVEPGYCVQLTPAEVAPGGAFDPLHSWLDERMAADESLGFFRPYARDTGGVAPERWHLSFAPVSVACAGQLDIRAIRECWDCSASELLLREELEADLPEILRRYVQVEEQWCPGRYRSGV